MTARDEVLGRIRAATRGGPPPAEVPRGYRSAGGFPPGAPELIDLLVHRLVDYRATVHRVAADGVPAAVLAAVSATESAGRRPVLVVPAGLPPGWLPDAVDAVTDDPAAGGLSVERLDVADGVVTAAAVAVAETGTIVLDGSAGQGRRVITLLPDLHVCVLRPEQVVGTVPEAIARLDPTRPLTWISGPSATSDIELNRVEGVHGPRNLHVVLALPA
jgi:L-lactate dehydrogenase complex protein LldG